MVHISQFNIAERIALKQFEKVSEAADVDINSSNPRPWDIEIQYMKNFL